MSPSSTLTLCLGILILVTLTLHTEARNRRRNGERSKLTSDKARSSGEDKPAVQQEESSVVSPGRSAEGLEGSQDNAPCPDCTESSDSSSYGGSKSKRTRGLRHRSRVGGRHRSPGYRQRAQERKRLLKLFRKSGSPRTNSSGEHKDTVKSILSTDPVELHTKTVSSVSKDTIPRSSEQSESQPERTDNQRKAQDRQTQHRSSQSALKKDQKKAASEKSDPRAYKGPTKRQKPSTDSRKREDHSPVSRSKSRRRKFSWNQGKQTSKNDSSLLEQDLEQGPVTPAMSSSQLMSAMIPQNSEQASNSQSNETASSSSIQSQRKTNRKNSRQRTAPVAGQRVAKPAVSSASQLSIEVRRKERKRLLQTWRKLSSGRRTDQGEDEPASKTAGEGEETHAGGKRKNSAGKRKDSHHTRGRGRRKNPPRDNKDDDESTRRKNKEDVTSEPAAEDFEKQSDRDLYSEADSKRSGDGSKPDSEGQGDERSDSEDAADGARAGKDNRRAERGRGDRAGFKKDRKRGKGRRKSVDRDNKGQNDNRHGAARPESPGKDEELAITEEGQNDGARDRSKKAREHRLEDWLVKHSRAKQRRRFLRQYSRRLGRHRTRQGDPDPSRGRTRQSDPEPGRDRLHQSYSSHVRTSQSHSSRDRTRPTYPDHGRSRQSYPDHVRSRQSYQSRERSPQSLSSRDRTRQNYPSNARSRQSYPSHVRSPQSHSSRDRMRPSYPSHVRSPQSHSSRDRIRPSYPSHVRSRPSHQSRERSQSLSSRDRTRQSYPSRERSQSLSSRDRTHQSYPSRERSPQSLSSRDRTRHSYPSRGRSRESYPSYETSSVSLSSRDRTRQGYTDRERSRQIQSSYERRRKEYERRRKEYDKRRQEHEMRRREYERQREKYERRRKNQERGRPANSRNNRRHWRRFLGPGRTSDVPIRPAAADRLERRLSPSLASSTYTLMEAMQRVLTALTNGLQAVHNDNDFVFNGTRYTIMMGVRKQLQEMAKVNDKVYDAILRTTLLTRDIYTRAHYNRLGAPASNSVNIPELSLPSLHEVIQSAYDEERLATQSLRNVKELIKERQNTAARLHQVRERFQDNFAVNDLRTLAYYVNSTTRRLSSELTYSSHAAYIKRNLDILQSGRNNQTAARDMLYKARDNLATASANYRGNYRVVQDWKRLRNDGSHAGAPVTLRRRGRPAPFRRDQARAKRTADDRARIRQIIDRLKRHAQEQERLAMQAEIILRPVIRRAQSLTREDDVAASAWMVAVASRLQLEGKKIYSLLDSIRELIGSKDVLRWRVVRNTCWDGGPDTEGSGCEGDGSGDLVLEEEDGEEGSGFLTGTFTDDEDFVFEDDKVPPTPRNRPTPLAKFGQQLSVYVDGMKLRSFDILQRGDLLVDTTDKMVDRWHRIRDSYDKAERAYRSWKKMEEVMQNVTHFVDDVKDMATAFSELVSRSHDSIKSRMERAVTIAERKAAEAQVRNARDDSRRSDTAPTRNDEVLVEAVEKAEAVRKETNVLRSLRQVAPQSCGRANVQLMKLHSNISHLRQQVDTAKALLQSMQLSISKTSGGYLSIPVPQTGLVPSRSPGPNRAAATPLSLVSTVQVCVQTKDTDGSVLVVKGNNSATFSLSMDDRQISVTVFDADGYNLETVTSDVTMEEDTWYDVKVTRKGKRVLLQVTSRAEGAVMVDNAVTVSDMPYLQPTPLHVYVGGVEENEPFSVESDTWRGCLGELKVDGRAVPLLNAASSGEAAQVCTSQCALAPDSSSFVFDGAGFLHFPASVLPMRRRMQSVHFQFRTRQSSAALLHLVNQRQRFLLRVVLSDGALMIDTTTPTESITLRSQSNSYNDGVFHTLKIQYRQSTTYPEIDGEDGAFTIERARPRSITDMADGVVAGAFVTGDHMFEKSNYRPLVGCMRELAIDDKPLSMTQAVMSAGVFSGGCHMHSVWSQCMQFGAESTGIDLGSLERSATVLLLFSEASRGPLLTYTRDGNFEAEIVATDEGLQVTTEEDDLSIARPDDVTSHFTLLSVTDDGATVTYTAWGEEVETSYGGIWGIKSDVDAEHHVTVALPLDSNSDIGFFGDLAQLIVGDRFIDLANYTLSNNLMSCERPLPDRVPSETQPTTRKPSSEDEEGTCNRNIQC